MLQLILLVVINRENCINLFLTKNLKGVGGLDAFYGQVSHQYLNIKAFVPKYTPRPFQGNEVDLREAGH